MTSHRRPLKRFLVLITIPLLLNGCNSVGLEKRMKQSESLRNLGEAYMIEGKSTMALKELLRAEQLYADDPYLQNDLGLTFMDKDKLERAVTHFKKAADLKPDWPNARNNLATAYLRLQQWDTAIGYLKELSEDLLYTTPHFAHLNLAWAYFNKGDFSKAALHYEETLAHYEDGFKKDGTYLKALVGLGRTDLRTGKIPKAVAVLERAAAFGPDVAAVHLELGKAYAVAGSRDQARQALMRAAELAPDNETGEGARAVLKRLK